MKLSAPIYLLKRRARLMARRDNISLHQALDHIAKREGFAQWSLLISKADASTKAEDIFTRLEPGNLVLIGARPGHGKTLFAIELLVTALRSGQNAALFTLELNQPAVEDYFSRLGATAEFHAKHFTLDCSDEICADYMIAQLETRPEIDFVVVDYLQMLDQRRQNVELNRQLQNLHAYVATRGMTMLFISQISRDYNAKGSAFPGLSDVRMPNPINLELFGQACFLRNRRVIMHEPAAS